jgi:hypothetical protein
MLMRGNTPPTTRSPPHQSRPTGNPPNRQLAPVGEEERGGRGPTSRRTSMKAAPDCRPPPTARHAPQPRTYQHQPPPSNKTQSTGSYAPTWGRGQRPSPVASFPPPVSLSVPRDRRPGGSAIPRGCADPQGLPHRSCFQQRFQGRLHAFKQLTCTVLVTHV